MSLPDPSAGRELRTPAFLLFGAGAVLLVLAVVTGSPVPVFGALPLLLGPVAAISGAPTGGARVGLGLFDEFLDRKSVV